MSGPLDMRAFRSGLLEPGEWFSGYSWHPIEQLLRHYAVVEVVDDHGWHFQYRLTQTSGSPPAGATGADQAGSPARCRSLGPDSAPVDPTQENARASLSTTPGPEQGKALPREILP